MILYKEYSCFISAESQINENFIYLSQTTSFLLVFVITGMQVSIAVYLCIKIICSDFKENF